LNEATNEPLSPFTLPSNKLAFILDNEKQIKKDINREAGDEIELLYYKKCQKEIETVGDVEAARKIDDEKTDVDTFNNLFGNSYVELSLGKPFDRSRGSTSLLTWTEKLEVKEMYSGVDFKVMREFTKEFYAIHKSGYIHAATYDLGEGRGSIDYFFKTQSDLNQFHASSLGPVTYLMAKKSYDERLFSLCLLIGTRWYEDSTNLYNLSGFLCKRTQSDWHLMRRTYLCILREKLGATQRFDVKEAINSFSSWFKSPYHPKLSEGKLKAIAGGSNTDGYKEWKKKYDISELGKETDPKVPRSQQLKQMLLERLEGNYRRDFGTGVVYERELDYYFVRKYTDPQLFLNAIFGEDEIYHMASKSDHKELIHFISNVQHPTFPFMQITYPFLGFSNGVYNLDTASFIEAADVPDGTQVRKMFTCDFEIKETPLFDAFIQYQFDHEDEIEFIYFILGRTLTRLTDKFDFMVMLYGQAGSGKSLLANLIKYTFGAGQVGIFGNSHEEKFGLYNYINCQILTCDDMPKNLAGTLPCSDFLAMMARGSVPCPMKGGLVTVVDDWNIPALFNTNSPPNYKDESGEIIRRTVIVEFLNMIEGKDKDLRLEQKIKEQEIATFIHRCRSTYLKYAKAYGGKDVEAFCPEIFKQSRNALREALNSTYRFASERLVYAEGKQITRTEMTKEFRLFVEKQYKTSSPSKEKINPPDVLRVDCRFEYFRNVCKHSEVGKLHKHKKGCCPKYNRTERSTSEIFLNMAFTNDEA
jgi:hypothetical protein